MSSRSTAPPDLQQLGRISSVRAAEAAIIEAVRTGSFAAALRGFTIHPLVSSEQIALEMLDDLLRTEPSLAALLGRPTG